MEPVIGLMVMDFDPMTHLRFKVGTWDEYDGSEMELGSKRNQC